MLVDESLRLRVAEAFERRPVWTKSALSYELDLDRIHLKTVIVGLAYCVSQGPYRLCWVSSQQSSDILHLLISCRSYHI